jgi:hypothetical protein
MTKDLTKDTRKTLLKNISEGRGTLLPIGIMQADEDIKKDLDRKNFSEAFKDLRDLSNCIHKNLWNDITENLKNSTLNDPYSESTSKNFSKMFPVCRSQSGTCCPRQASDAWTRKKIFFKLRFFPSHKKCLITYL